ncbi:disulfide bond formation protein B [uncultured Aquabacterium sp.]|jgi:disulfide bond formation protein DsbB|uniref:disulfide bond formation protein B n=1 Tax=uncultured Aquabacterium sp. TaxID=158753 RepID=UPI00260270B5|nr:disulfide bond formation protein B [uncultured Aquabacterium sp.]
MALTALPSRTLLTGLGAVCALSVGFALYAQHQWGMEPCPWCILQRILFVAVAVLCLIGAALPAGWPRRAPALVGVLLSASGIAAALWQHFVAARTNSCALTLADKVISGLGLDTRWPEVFEVRASCADAAVNLLGVPFAFWSLALFAVVGLVLLTVAVSPARRA